MFGLGEGAGLDPEYDLKLEAFPEPFIQGPELGFGNQNRECLFPSMNSRTLRGSAAQCQGS